MNYELTGTVNLLQDLQTFSSGFTKREVIVSVQDGQYTQEISIEFLKDKVALLDNLVPGQQVTISFNIQGREYNGRYYNNLQGWRIDSSEPFGTPITHVNQTKNTPPTEDFEFDDIPF